MHTPAAGQPAPYPHPTYLSPAAKAAIAEHAALLKARRKLLSTGWRVAAEMRAVAVALRGDR